MSKLIRVNINLDNSHSLTDFPVDIYSGTTTGNTTNLVYAAVTTSPVTFQIDDNILTFGLKLVSTGCLDQVLLIESPRVDCEICADFVEYLDPAPTPQPSVTPNPTATIGSTPNPTATIGSTPPPTPSPSPSVTIYLAPPPTPSPSPSPSTTASPTPPPTPSPSPTPVPEGCLEYSIFANAGVLFSVSYIDCDGNRDSINVDSGDESPICSTVYPTVTAGSGTIEATGLDNCFITPPIEYYSCGDGEINLTTDLLSYGVYPNKMVSPDDNVNSVFFWNAIDRPNRFNIYSNGSLLYSTGWKGQADYPGPWGSTLNTETLGNIGIIWTSPLNRYINVEFGSSPTLTDTATWSLGCG